MVSMSDYGFRAPFGWRVIGLCARESEVVLRWPDALDVKGELCLRIAVLDTREPLYRVEICGAKSGRRFGEFEIRWAAHFQVFEANVSADLMNEGAVLRLSEGEKPLWIIADGGDVAALPDALSPHLLVAGSTDLIDKRAQFFERLQSLASVQCFGWMEGCVLDGLDDLGADAALRAHLSCYFSADGGPFYEAFANWPDGKRAFGAPADEKIYGIEATLPFAALCRVFPDHPALQRALDFWEDHADEAGVVQDGAQTSSEGTYTVGTPMAVIACARGDRELARRALLQVEARHERLFDGEIFARTRQRNDAGGFDYGNRNWARGIAWQLLGAARTLRELEGLADTSHAQAQFHALAHYVRRFQLPGGLWSVFVDEPQLAPDTSGSAAIAAAFAIGARNDWLDSEFLEAARRTDAALDNYLTPDGFLRGASAPNKGGEALQRAPYRPIYQMGMGLMAQLIAASKP